MYRELLDDLDTATKDLGVDEYIRITIFSEDGNDKKIFRIYEIPRRIIHNRLYVLTWIKSYFQVRNPHCFVQHKIDCFDNASKRPLGISSTLQKVISAKAQVTRQKRLLLQYEEDRKKTLFSDMSEDAIYQKGLIKLREKEMKLQMLQEQLKSEPKITTPPQDTPKSDWEKCCGIKRTDIRVIMTEKKQDFCFGGTVFDGSLDDLVKKLVLLKNEYHVFYQTNAEDGGVRITYK